MKPPEKCHVFLSPQICNLEEQLEQFREELENKSEEVQQLHMQLEIQRKEISSQQEYLETRDSLLQVNKRCRWNIAQDRNTHSCPMWDFSRAKT